jgi:hypothetical protein
VVDSTLTVEAQDVELDKLPGVDTSAVADFRKQNSETHSLGYLAAGGLGFRIVLVSRQNLDSFLHNGPEAYWQEFYRRYPGSNGSISFSSIGYTADGNTAVLVVDQGCGTLCGALSNIVVKRERGRWHVSLVQVKVMS